MDGSEVTVVVLGHKGVGKSSFIHHCFVDPLGPAGVSQYAKVLICGREISIRIVDNPGRHQLVRAIMVIMLFDLTQKESFKGLQQLLEVAQRVSPVALRAVVGTKADLMDSREVTTEEALGFCRQHSGNAVPLPYYETSTKFSDSILLAFQEIMARPLINDYVIKTTTEHEQNIFVQEVMEWAISSNSANILTHLRDMGYPIPLDIVEKYPLVIRDYLLGEYPLREVPRYKYVELKDPNETASWEDSLLDSFEEGILTIQDTRPNIEVTRTYHLMWSDISLPLFLTCFLDEEAMNIRRLTHVDLSHNKLTFIPHYFFQMPLLESLDLSHNKLTNLPTTELWRPHSTLQYLKLGHNLLTGEVPTPTRPGMICPALWYVDLSHNYYHTFPHFLLQFSLHHLDISHNEVTQLPPELSKMDQLQTLELAGLSLVDPPSFVVEEGPEAILRYLRLKLRNKLGWSTLRVVVVGPHLSGKTTLISKITGCASSGNKALDVVEWKYRGNEIFSFRSRWFTFNLWDFSGDPKLNFMYASFKCENSLHLVVCDAIHGVHDLVRQLADLQSLSEERVIVMVIFTHMDKFKTREDKERFKKTSLEWLSHHNKQGGNGSFSLMATTSVRSLQGEDMLASYDADVPHEGTETTEVKGPDIPLMPLVLRIHFVSCDSGEGIPGVKKTLYKIASGSFLTQLTPFPRSTLMVRDVPFLYTQLESTLRQLRVSHHDNQERQQHVFYTVEELQEQLKTPLAQLKVTPADFRSAINFIHKMGLIYVHRCGDGQLVVCLDPQLIGCLLQHTLHACHMSQEASPSAVFLANTHLCMMWGVEAILNLDRNSTTSKCPKVTCAHLLHFLEHLKVFSPLLPGVMLVTPTLPHTLPRSCDPDSTQLTPRRSYVFSYLPSFFHIHLLSRVVSAIVTTSTPLSSPTSPNHPSPPPTVPITLPSGVELYLWQKNLFVCDGEHCRVWVRMREVDVGLDPLPYCGRIDLHLKAPSLAAEAHWLRLITTQINKLLEEVYPGLLDASRPQKVEVFVPLSDKTEAAELLSLGGTREEGLLSPAEDEALADNGQHSSDQQSSNDSSPLNFISDNVSPDLSGPASQPYPVTTLPSETASSETMPPSALKRSGTTPSAETLPPSALRRSGTTPSAEAPPPSALKRTGTTPSVEDIPLSVLRRSGTTPSSETLPLSALKRSGTTPSAKTSPLSALKKSGTTPSPSDNESIPSILHRSGTAPSRKTTPPSVLQRSGTVPSTSSTKTTPLSVVTKTTSSSADGSSATSPSILGLSETAPSSGQGSRKISNASPSSGSSGRVAKLSEHSWEVVSKFSTTSNRLSVLQDQSDPDYSLVPLWECLQEAFKTPVVRVETTRLTLSEVIPDLLFADLPPEFLFRTKVSPPDCYLMSFEDRFFGGVAPPSSEDTGMFVQSYYSPEHADVFVRQSPGALKAFYLQSCLATLRKDLLKLQQLHSSHLVVPVGVQYCPPSLAVEAAPFGSLRSWMRRLRHKMNRVDTHHITLQLLSALDYFHSCGTSYHCISSDTVLMWNLNPLVVKLAHTGITHSSKDCQLCDYNSSLPADHSIIQTYRFDYMLLGLLVFEMATGKQAFEDIYPLSTVVLAVLHDKMQLNVEADHFLQKQGKQGTSEEECFATGCQRLCLQSTIDHCLSDPVSHRELETRFSLCAGDHTWSPMRLLVNVEVMITSVDSEQVYWASGSRGLVTGSLLPSTGKLDYNLLQEAPPPESGLFANRRCKPVPIAVGRASGLALVQATNQLWVGTENGAMGSVYIFNLPDMRRHHHIHLQDAVLTLCAVNHLGDSLAPGKDMRYRVLVGLANGTIILFLGVHGGKVLENPLQGPKIVIGTHQRRPCLTLTLTSEGHMWCSCGSTMEVYDMSTLKLVRRLSASQGAAMGRGDVITLMIVSVSGVWTVGRRSTMLRLWDRKTGKYRASYDVAEVVRDADADITALAVKGGALWLGTRNGYLLILDSYLMEERRDPLLGLQQCGQGKVKCIVPLTPLPNATSKLQVMCSLEFADEVSCQLLAWEYFYTSGQKGSTPLDHTPRISATLPDLMVSSPHSELQQCKSF